MEKKKRVNILQELIGARSGSKGVPNKNKIIQWQTFNGIDY